jgi:hypothetical protein
MLHRVKYSFFTPFLTIFLRSLHGPIALAGYCFGMSTARTKMHFTHLYDHVLSELEFGRTETGINLLVGMLDAAEMQNAANCSARNALHDHPLHAMLLEDPMFADALQRPSNPVHRVNMLNQPGVDDRLSSTGRRIFAATSEIAFTRALRHRREHAQRKLCKAWRAGEKIWLIADPRYDLLSSLDGFDVSNILVSSENEARESSAPDAVAGSKFDLILAPHLPDQLGGRAMQQASIWLCRHLSSTGEFATSALLPGHPGTGWRRACFSWEPKCHDDRALARMAAPGLTKHSYRDETGCIAWLEIRLT